ncbi:LuxR C-terminal-related transcriptional regulator [Psychromarinibacter sp. C21-152]|uniref:LuxR C-terminal-related transcriptional regulator n=1 Tax=Psychromarinibacter sediminicola TaxID=3033385 RepID=A0AAE3NWZ5_9RHOB|nr:LuxR C-terminal-related transcriptional regulator [Psychromarinibacter sediminicola]MDF0603209.1 LuxR C-terminal-related transcriptional regulator [Psychromarinibacter sediminicola]
MLFASDLRGIAYRLNRNTVQRFPEAILGIIFAEAKSGDIDRARRDFDLWHDDLAEASAGGTLAADLVLVDIHLSVYEDRPFDDATVERLEGARVQLPDHDFIGKALASNLLCNIALQMGDFDQAQKCAEQAIQLYRQGDGEFGALHLHTHLAQIRLMRGDLLGAGEVLQSMEKNLSEMPGQAQWLIAVARILRAEVAYEANDLHEASRLCATAFALVEHRDAWFDILTAAYRVNTRLAFSESGLPGALEALSHGEQIARDRGMPRLFRLMQIERLRALTLSNETRSAARLLTEIGLSTDRTRLEESDDLAFRQGTTFVAVARLMVRTRRAREALEFIAPAEDLAIRRGQLLALAKLRVIAAAAHWGLGSRVDATSSLLSAIRLLGDQPFCRFILDEGPEMAVIVQAALDGDHVSVPPTPAQRRRLSEMMHHWATSAWAGKGQRRAGAADLRRRYLELMAVGHSNKEIARIMGVTTNTVKYHLKEIFRDLGADNRGRAVQRARDPGLLDH